MSSSFLDNTNDPTYDPYSALFDEEKARKAAAAVKIFQDVSVGSSKEKMRESGEQERQTISRGAEEQRTSAEQAQQSSKQTKHETTNRPNERIDIELFDQWVDNLTSSDQEAFISFASDNYSVIEAFLYARFLGYTGSIVACESWIKTNYKKPDHRKTLLNEIDEMLEDIRKLREDVDNGYVKRDAGVARIANMQKELRGTIAQVELFTANKDRKGLLMAGADRAIRELMFIFKDDPIELPLEEASMSVWARMQLEE